MKSEWMGLKENMLHRTSQKITATEGVTLKVNRTKTKASKGGAGPGVAEILYTNQQSIIH